MRQGTIEVEKGERGERIEIMRERGEMRRGRRGERIDRERD